MSKGGRIEIYVDTPIVRDLYTSILIVITYPLSGTIQKQEGTISGVQTI